MMPAAPDHVRDQLEDWGFDVELVDVSEFHKARRLDPLPDQPAGHRGGSRPARGPGRCVVLPPV